MPYTTNNPLVVKSCLFSTKNVHKEWLITIFGTAGREGASQLAPSLRVIIEYWDIMGCCKFDKRRHVHGQERPKAACIKLKADQNKQRSMFQNQKRLALL